MPDYPFFIWFAGEITAFAAMGDLLFLAAYTEISAAAATVPEAIIRYLPAAFAQRRFFHHLLGTFGFSNPFLAFKLFD